MYEVDKKRAFWELCCVSGFHTSSRVRCYWNTSFDMFLRDLQHSGSFCFPLGYISFGESFLSVQSRVHNVLSVVMDPSSSRFLLVLHVWVQVSEICSWITHQFEEQFCLLKFSSISISRGLLVVLCGHHLGNWLQASIVKNAETIVKSPRTIIFILKV